MAEAIVVVDRDLVVIGQQFGECLVSEVIFDGNLRVESSKTADKLQARVGIAQSQGERDGRKGDERKLPGRNSGNSAILDTFSI